MFAPLLALALTLRKRLTTTNWFCINNVTDDADSTLVTRLDKSHRLESSISIARFFDLSILGLATFQHNEHSNTIDLTANVNLILHIRLQYSRERTATSRQ